jgi:8-oxo-dGTP pyrophosphatase MutT (NUDIX family)
MEQERRRAARLIVLDAAQRVLLFRYRTPAGEPARATPGGGLEGDESYEQAAMREAAEELGARLPAGALQELWHAVADIEWGARRIRQRETFFLLRVERLDLTDEVRASRSRCFLRHGGVVKSRMPRPGNGGDGWRSRASSWDRRANRPSC